MRVLPCKQVVEQPHLIRTEGFYHSFAIPAPRIAVSYYVLTRGDFQCISLICCSLQDTRIDLLPLS